MTGTQIHQRRRYLAYLPAIRAGEPAGDRSIGESVKHDARFIRESLVSRSDFFHRVFGDRKFSLPGQAVDKIPFEVGREVHGEKVDLTSTYVKILPPIQFIYPVETEAMTEREWQKRPWFLQWVEEARAMLKASGGKGTYVEVAQIMDLAPNSMKKYTSEEWTGARPGPDALRRLGDYLGRDYRILYDGPDTPPAGIDPAAWAAASETRKLFAITMFHKSESFLPEHFKAFNQMIDSGVTLQRARKNRS